MLERERTLKKAQSEMRQREAERVASAEKEEARRVEEEKL